MPKQPYKLKRKDEELKRLLLIDFRATIIALNVCVKRAN